MPDPSRPAHEDDRTVRDVLRLARDAQQAQHAQQQLRAAKAADTGSGPVTGEHTALAERTHLDQIAAGRMRRLHDHRRRGWVLSPAWLRHLDSRAVVAVGALIGVGLLASMTTVSGTLVRSPGSGADGHSEDGGGLLPSWLPLPDSPGTDDGEQGGRDDPYSRYGRAGAPTPTPSTPATPGPGQAQPGQPTATLPDGSVLPLSTSGQQPATGSSGSNDSGSGGQDSGSGTGTPQTTLPPITLPDIDVCVGRGCPGHDPAQVDPQPTTTDPGQANAQMP